MCHRNLKNVLRWKSYCLAFLLLSLLSCSSDDDGSLTINYQNMMGKWNLKSIEQTDGTIVTYSSLCATEKDYIEFTLTGAMRTNRFFADCETISVDYCPDFDVKEDHVIDTCFGLDDGKITQLSDRTFRVAFPEPEYFVMMSAAIGDTKAVTFEKRQ